jgi:hypothetical protein
MDRASFFEEISAGLTDHAERTSTKSGTCCDLATKSGSWMGNVPARIKVGRGMAEQISPAFHAEIIVILFDDYKDLRRVKERVGVLLSDASAEHVEAVGCRQVFAD